MFSAAKFSFTKIIIAQHLYRHAILADERKQNVMESALSALNVIPLAFPVLSRMSGGIPVERAGTLKFAECAYRTLTCSLYRAYVEELEKRVQFLEGQLEQQRSIRDSYQDSTQVDHSHASPPATPSTVDDPVMPQNEAETDRLNHSDQDFYIINSHDGKMRFFGEC